MPNTPSRLLVVCFCAAWCRTCDDYVRVLDALKAQFAQQVEFVWLDIEDHSEVLDNVDVENFPTLLISDARQVYFWGAILPHAATASQLIERILAGDIRALDAHEILQLDKRVRTFLSS